MLALFEDFFTHCHKFSIFQAEHYIVKSLGILIVYIG